MKTGFHRHFLVQLARSVGRSHHRTLNVDDRSVGFHDELSCPEWKLADESGDDKRFLERDPG